jgi:uncharacterized PurR-regulated membrane protein YhhQ (DUF165 family)
MTHPSEEVYRIRRERVFLVLAGLFLGAMAMLNILGLTRFVRLGPLTVAVGVLPYPITFLCTDLIGELYGRKRAAFVVWAGFVVNLFVIGFMWLGSVLPDAPPGQQPAWQTLQLREGFVLADGRNTGNEVELFEILFACTAGSVVASMAAYLAAQFCDVYVFHFWKKLTRGRHLWLRNNGSTLVSQLVDSFVVIGIVFGRQLLGGEMALGVFVTLMLSNYAFKAFAALTDTIPFYVGVRYLARYLGIDPRDLHEAERW